MISCIEFLPTGGDVTVVRIELMIRKHFAVLTSMNVDPHPEFVNQTEQGHEAWRAMHEEWFRRSRNGLHIVTTRSGHHIQDDEPELVIEAIRFVLDHVRTQ